MTETLEYLLARYGQEITLTHGGESRVARAFLQAMREEGKAAPYAVTPLGTADDRRIRCICREALTEGDSIGFQGKRFRVRNAAAAYLGGELCHYRAVLQEEQEAAE